MTWLNQLIQSTTRIFQWWVTVATWEQGVRVRFGKRTKHLLPGVHFRIPFLDRVVVVCVRERVVDTDNKTVTTSDGKALTFGLSMRYSISNAKLMIESVARPEGTMRELALAVACEHVSSTHSNDLTPHGIAEAISSQVGVAKWGLEKFRPFVTTFAYTRTLRLLQAQDNGYTTAFDHRLDENPCKVS